MFGAQTCAACSRMVGGGCVGRGVGGADVQRLIRRTGVVVLLVVGQLIESSPSRALEPAATQVVVGGIKASLYKLPTPNVVYIAKINPKAAARLKVATPRPGSDSRAPTSVLCRRCYVAVNGGFFYSNGAPVPGWEPSTLAKLLDPATRNSVTTVYWLLRDGVGKPLANDSFTHSRHPRTFIFGNDRGTISFGTVDGRQRHSVGMTLPEVQSLVRELGATWAVNLDGGCSTTFVVQGSVKNSPCQDSSSVNGERPVANAFVALPPARR